MTTQPDLFAATPESVKALSLSAFNLLVQQAVTDALPGTYWVCAETSDVRVNPSSGHCYLEFVEKDSRSEQPVARARGNIWARTFVLLRPYFEQSAGQPFASGLRVMVRVSAEFHPLYGYSLTVHDIDPTYTLGDRERRRAEIIRQLKDDGIFDLNRELTMPLLPQRIAVVTSSGAAGYEDFIHQLTSNRSGYAFYPKLFEATMQGDRAEASIIEALDRIEAAADCFDVVVLVRGGGATSDLSCFDAYTLAAHCAQFPLPLITGIGHERDDSIVDRVAHTRTKTPTAAAAFLISRMDTQAELLNALQQAVCETTTAVVDAHRTRLTLLATRLPVVATSSIEAKRRQLLSLKSGLAAATRLIAVQEAELAHRKHLLRNNTERLLTVCKQRLTACKQQLNTIATAQLTDHRQALGLLEQFVQLASPAYILQRGYTLTLRNGSIVKRAEELASGDTIVTRFADGEQSSVIL